MEWPSMQSSAKALEALAWGSRSMRRTRCWSAARQAARLTEVVVLPTPPFWFATATVFIRGKPATLPVRHPLSNPMPAAVEITERMLSDTGGWQALKEGKGLWEAGKVAGATYEP